MSWRIYKKNVISNLNSYCIYDKNKKIKLFKNVSSSHSI